VQVLEAVASAHGASVAQVAIAWLLQRSPVMLPIPASPVSHLAGNVAAAAPRLSDGDLDQLGR
jgi:aryl-alcohol dehydrogenase-like predicted oxidoreductase